MKNWQFISKAWFTNICSLLQHPGCADPRGSEVVAVHKNPAGISVMKWFYFSDGYSLLCYTQHLFCKIMPLGRVLLATLSNLNSFIWALDTCFLDWMVLFDSKHFSSLFPKQVRIKPAGPAGSAEELAISPASDWSRSSRHRAGRRERKRKSPSLPGLSLPLFFKRLWHL